MSLIISIVTVSVLCKDTRIAVQVRTNKPFNGRIYALGRSETCNIDVVNSDLFRLDLTMAGQDCNTQSVVSYLTTFQIYTPKIGSQYSVKICFLFLDWSVFQHCCPATPQRSDDESGQDLQSQVHVRHELEEHHIWNGTNQVSKTFAM